MPQKEAILPYMSMPSLKATLPIPIPTSLPILPYMPNDITLLLPPLSHMLEAMYGGQLTYQPTPLWDEGGNRSA